MARLLSNTTIYGSANVQGTLYVGTANANTSVNTTSGSLIVTGGLGVSGNIYAATVYDNGLSVGLYAQAAYAQANAISSYANTTLAYGTGVDTGQNTYAQAAYSQANSISTYANTTLGYISGVDTGQNAYAQAAYSQANAISSYANTTLTYYAGIQTGQNSYAQAAYASVNLNSSYANTTLTYISGIDTGQNAYAQAAYAQANAISSYANTTLTYAAGVDTAQNAYTQAAFNQANTANTRAYASLPLTGGTITGSLSVDQNVTVSANLSVLGTFTTYSSNTVTTNSSMIFVGTNNTGNVVDLGIVGSFKGGTNNNQQYTGVVRDPNNGYWRFFSNVFAQPTTVVNFAEANLIFDAIQVGGIISPTATINNLELYSYTTAAYAQANAISSYANTQITLNNGVNTGQNAYAQAAFASVNLNSSYANTTLTYLAGVNLGQNAYAQAAFAYANTSLQNTATVITSNNFTVPGQLKILNSTATNALVIEGTSTKGGAGYHDFLQANNKGAGATNTNKWFRLSSIGELQIISNDYTTNIFNLTDTGTLGAPVLSTPILMLNGIANTRATTTTTTSTSATTIDTFATASFRTAKYLIQMTQSTNYHAIELMLVHNGTTAYMSQFNEVTTGTSLGTFDASIAAGGLSLNVTPVSATSMTINIKRETIVV